jgi:hypothetical protein
MYPTQHQWALLEAYKQYPFPLTPLQFLQIKEASRRVLAWLTTIVSRICQPVTAKSCSSNRNLLKSNFLRIR